MNAGRHALLGASDQGLSSLASLVLTVGAFRSGLLEPGQTAVMLIVWSISIGVARSLYAEPIASLAEPSCEPWRVHMAPAAGALVGTMAIGSLAQAATVLVTGVSPAAVGVGVTLAAMTAADAVRSVAQATAHPDVALAASAMSLIGITVGFVADTATGGSAGAFLGAGFTAVAVVVAGFSLGPVHRGDVRPHHLNYLSEYILTSGSVQIAALLGGALVSNAVPITLRVGSTAFGLYLVGLQAAALMAVPLLRGPLRAWAFTHRVRSSLALSATLLALLAINAATLLMIAEYGTDLLGGAWSEATDVLPFYAVSLVGGALTAGPFLLLRALDSRADSLRLRAFSGTLQLITPIVCGAIWGASGFFLGALGASLATAAIGLTALRTTGRPSNVNY